MSSAKTLHKLDSTHRGWLTRLQPLDETAFARVPEGGGWAIGQVCHHVGSVSDMLLGNAERAAAGDGQTKGFQFQPWMLTVMGRLPPMRIKVPVASLPPEMHVFANPQQLSKSEGFEQLAGVVERMRSTAPAVDGSTKTCRRRHPVGGWLNAMQWFQLTEMHMRHHLRQIDRLL